MWFEDAVMTRQHCGSGRGGGCSDQSRRSRYVDARLGKCAVLHPGVCARSVENETCAGFSRKMSRNIWDRLLHWHVHGPSAQTDKGSMRAAAKHAMLGLEPVMSHLNKHPEALCAVLLRTAQTLPTLPKDAHILLLLLLVLVVLVVLVVLFHITLLP